VAIFFILDYLLAVYSLLNQRFPYKTLRDDMFFTFKTDNKFIYQRLVFRVFGYVGHLSYSWGVLLFVVIIICPSVEGVKLYFEEFLKLFCVVLAEPLLKHIACQPPRDRVIFHSELLEGQVMHWYGVTASFVVEPSRPLKIDMLLPRKRKAPIKGLWSLVE
jgi:hypothetical protein